MCKCEDRDVRVRWAEGESGVRRARAPEWVVRRIGAGADGVVWGLEGEEGKGGEKGERGDGMECE